MAYTGREPFPPVTGGTGIANANTSTLTLGGALSTVGSFTSAFTMTGNTAVTFPTSGTLATTSEIFAASFVTNSGTATPTAGVLNILGAVTAPGTSPFATSGATDVVTINVQKSQAIAATDATKIGLSVFDSADFTVDADGFVSIVANLSLNSLTLAVPLDPASGGTGVNNGINTLTLAGNLSTSGAFASDFVMTGPTTVTFPTSGTLATTSQIPSITATNHALLIGGAANAINSLGVATNGQIAIGSTGADPVLAVPTNGNNITWTAGAGSLAANLTGTNNHSVQIGNASGSLSSLGVATNGQLLIGSTGADPVLATLISSNSSVNITNGAGSIDLTVGTGFSYSDQATTFTAATANGYFCTGTLTANLPAITASGMKVEIISTSTNIVTVTANGSDTIQISNDNAASFASAFAGDTLVLVSRLTDTVWYCTAVNGNWA